MYLDTSVLVKLFVREPDSEFYGNLTNAQLVCSSVLAYTEVASALLAKERAGGLRPEDRHRAWAAFERHVREETLELLPLGPAIFRRATWILEKCHPTVALRSLDALHLASADQAQDWPLVTHDQRMRDAAAILGMSLSALPK